VPFLTVPELAVKYRTSEDHLIRAVAAWVRSGCLIDNLHYRRRNNYATPPRYPREYDERVIAILIIRDREKDHCREAFLNGYAELMAVVRS